MRALWNFGSSLLGAATGQAPREYAVGGRRLAEERPISEGGFSFVVQVRDLNSGQQFALKKVLCHDEERLKAAQREVEILENLPMHKNIVGYFGHAVEQAEGETAGKWLLLLLELCPGGHLLDFLDKHRGVLPEADLLKAFTDVVEAVFCLHSLSPPVQHRDLKLENVLQGEDGFWKLVDFGSWSSEKIDLSSTPVRQLALLSEEVGRDTTPMYRPPEMVDVYQRLPIFCAVDIWMLGCILYCLIYNRHPFQEAASLAILGGQYALPPRTPAPEGKLVELVVWLLAHDPRHRPSSRQLVTTLWQWQDLEALDQALQPSGLWLVFACASMPDSTIDEDVGECKASPETTCAKRARTGQEHNAGPLSEFVVSNAGVRMPRLIYGTAWKEERTEDMVVRAVKAGFRGIDTACQPKHYREQGVGAALALLLGSALSREDLFVQTKVNRHFAAELAPGETLERQVEASVSKSLSNLGLSYVDSLVLHSPYSRHDDTMQAWRAMEAAVKAGKARQLGISNLKSLKELRRIYQEAEVKPAVVQQRFYADTGFEHEMRAWCVKEGIYFQSFWTLTANSKLGRRGKDLVVSPVMKELSAKYGVTPQVLFFRFTMDLGITPLTGTTSDEHMAQDLGARAVPLEKEDAERIEALMRQAVSDRSD